MYVCVCVCVCVYTLPSLSELIGFCQPVLAVHINLEERRPTELQITWRASSFWERERERERARERESEREREREEQRDEWSGGGYFSPLVEPAGVTAAPWAVEAVSKGEREQTEQKV